MCVGRGADLELAEPGDQTAVQVGTQSFLLVRGDDGRLRAFHNVCRHRGHELLAVGEHRTNAASSARTTPGSTGSKATFGRRRVQHGLPEGDFPFVEARLGGLARLALPQRER